MINLGWYADDTKIEYNLNWQEDFVLFFNRLIKKCLYVVTEFLYLVNAPKIADFKYKKTEITDMKKKKTRRISDNHLLIQLIQNSTLFKIFMYYTNKSIFSHREKT